ncbi:MAG TPA: thioredoxin domain-containing protein [Vicinamibacteria bacterium]|jgi:protein-disulfide isomerase
MGRWRIVLAFLLLLGAAAASALLLLHHRGVQRATAAVNQVCGEDQAGGCETVNRSRFSEIGPLPLAAIGLAFYLSLALLLFLASLAGPEARDAAAVAALLALLISLAVDLVLLGIQALAVRAFCRLCLLTYALAAAAVIVLIRARRDPALIRDVARVPDGRVLVAGALAGALAFTAAVVSADRALVYRARSRQTPLLGVSSSPMTPFVPAPSLASPRPLAASPLAAVPSGSAPTLTDIQRYQEEARVAQEQARRLQEILDDPKKLEQHFAEKAAREFAEAPVRSLDVKNVPYKGPAEAPIKVVEFSDFLCPFCREIAAAFAGFIPKSGDRIVLYYKNYPLDQACNASLKSTVHPGACNVALGAICAQEQGRFWPYHDRVFANPPKEPKVTDVVRIGAEAGLDAAALETCINAPRTRDRLTSEVAEGKNYGVNSTPTLFINGKRLPRINDFVPMVDKESARLGLPPLPNPGP